jgi:hypothetical protein
LEVVVATSTKEEEADGWRMGREGDQRGRGVRGREAARGGWSEKGDE